MALPDRGLVDMSEQYEVPDRLRARPQADNVDEIGEPRLVGGLVEDFKNLQALRSPQLSLKNWCVTGQELASILRRRPVCNQPSFDVCILHFSLKRVL